MDDDKIDLESSDFPKLGGLPKWQKYLIIGAVIAAFVILIIIIIILIATSGEGGGEKPEPEEKKEKKKQLDNLYVIMIFQTDKQL